MRRNAACRRFFHSCPLLLSLALCFLVVLFPRLAAAQNQAAPPAQAHNGPAKLDAWPGGILKLTDSWRFHRGDDPAYAKPDFDDGSWQKGTLQQFQVDKARVTWLRLHVVVPPHHGPLALSILGLRGAYQVFMNGAQVPGSRLLPAVLHKRAFQTVPLPPVKNKFELAIRVLTPPFDQYFFPIHSVSIGTLPLVKGMDSSNTASMILSQMSSMPMEIGCIFVGLAVLGLFYFQRGHKEYMWLGLYLITNGASWIALAGSILLFPQSVNTLFGDPATYLFTFFQIEFTFAFVHQKVSRPWRAYELLLLVSFLVSFVTNSLGILGTPYYIAYEGFVTLPATLILPVLLWFWYRKGNREAGLLVIPSIFPGLTCVLNNAQLVAEFGFHWNGLRYLSAAIPFGPFGFHVYDLANLIFLLAIGALIFLRFTEVSRAEARTAAELDAAREIQQTLVPAMPPSVEGYQLAAAYLPAAEVGGDFYQVLPLPDKSTLIVVGDVSGKGLKAAMRGTVALGAVQSLAQEMLSPAQVLTRLNVQLIQSSNGGFITCLCAHITPNGTLTVANAGHLSPYRNGEEIPLDSGLPLGITESTEYSEKSLQLNPGDKLTFLSDGVIEARNPEGELYGFDRTRAISTQSAQQIAEAAQQFGQEDDITVLSLNFVPTEVAQA